MPDDSQKEKLDARLKAMEAKATALEEQAEYAEKEAGLRERMTEAKNKIVKHRPPLSLLPLPHIPGGASRYPIGLLAIVIIILLIVKAC